MADNSKSGGAEPMVWVHYRGRAGILIAEGYRLLRDGPAQLIPARLVTRLRRDPTVRLEVVYPAAPEPEPDLDPDLMPYLVTQEQAAPAAEPEPEPEPEPKARTRSPKPKGDNTTAAVAEEAPDA